VAAYACAYAGFVLADLHAARGFIPLAVIVRTFRGPMLSMAVTFVACRGMLLLAAKHASPVPDALAALATGAVDFALVEWAIDRENLANSTRFLLRRD
jgi:hypothetical protein